MSEEKKSPCGCGDRAIKLRDSLGLSEDEFPNIYVHDHHAKATVRMVAKKLSYLLNRSS